MRKIKMFITLLLLGFMGVSIGQVSPSSLGLYPALLDASVGARTQNSSCSAINKQYVAISNHYVDSPDDCYRDLRLFDKSTGALLAHSKEYSWDHRDATKILFDPTNDKVIYAVYNERTVDTPGATREVYIKKFEYDAFSGSFLEGSRKSVSSTNSVFGASVASNGDVLVGNVQSDGAVHVNVFEDIGMNMVLLNTNVIAGSGSGSADPPNSSVLFDVSMDSYEDDFVVGYNNGDFSNPDARIQKYSYDGLGNISIIHDFLRVGNPLFENNAINFENSVRQNLTLKPSGEILYVNKASGINWEILKLTGAGSFVTFVASGMGPIHMVTLDNSKTVVARLITSGANEGDWVLDQYSWSDLYQYTHIISDEIGDAYAGFSNPGGFNHISDYACDILVCGEDLNDINGGISGNEDIYYELFSCDYCVENCCPPSPELVVDCEEGIITVEGDDKYLVLIDQTWSYTGDGDVSIIYTEEGEVNPITLEIGTYTLTLVYMNKNGEICEYRLTIEIDATTCCENDATELEAYLDEIAYDTEYVSPDAYGWGVDVPVVCDVQGLYDFITNGFCADYYTVKNSTFDTGSWTDITTYYTDGGAGAPPTTVELEPGDYVENVVNHFQVSVGSPYQVIDILWIPRCCNDAAELTAAINETAIGTRSVTSATYGWTVDVPVFCDESRIYDFITNNKCADYYTVKNSTFDTDDWVDITTYYTDGAPGAPPTDVALGSGEYVTGVVNHFQVSIGAAYEVVDILWIPDCNIEEREGGRVKQTGGSTQMNELNVEIYPNPSSSAITLQLDQTTSGIVSIYSLEGKLVRTMSFNEKGRIDLKVEDLENGVYYINIQTEDQVVTKELIKQ